MENLDGLLFVLKVKFERRVKEGGNGDDIGEDGVGIKAEPSDVKPTAKKVYLLSSFQTTFCFHFIYQYAIFILLASFLQQTMLKILPTYSK